MSIELPWEVIDKYFNDNKNVLISHQLNSFNDFFENGINRIFQEKNPIKILKQQNPDTKEFELKAYLYIGGKDGKSIYYGKPTIYDQDREHYMYPNIARLRNMTYSITIHYDVLIEYYIIEGEETIQTSTTLEKIFLGRFPIMLNSNLCILNNMEPSVKFNMGECKNDLGGYFIIDGKEKTIVSQEKFADNMLYIKNNYNEIYACSAEIRSVSEDSSKPIRTVAVRLVSPTSKFTNKQLVVNIPNVRKPIPLFIVMRALGIESDKKIIKYCLLDLEKYNTYLELFVPSVHDAGRIFTQNLAIKYIATFTKGKTVSHVLEILMNYFLPHIGTNNFNEKAFFLGYMVIELLKVYTKEKKPTDRDSFKYKRVDLPGYLLYDLFKEYYTLQQRAIYQTIDKEYYYKQGLYQKNFTSLIENNYKDIFKERIVETGFKKAFKGNWGSQSHTKKSGVVQDLNRLSFNSYISHLRKINLPLDAATKIVGPRLLHSSQWGIIDPVDTPDGGNIGLHKHMAMGTYITSHCSKYPLIELLKNNLNLKLLSECSIEFIAVYTKVIINGDWIGMFEFPIPTIDALKHHRRLGLIPIYTSILWNKEVNTIFIYTDSGRLTRPIFYIENKIPSYKRTASLYNKILERKFSWIELLTGFNEKKNITSNLCTVYNNTKDLYGTISIESLIENEGIIEYIDTSEEEGTLIAMSEDNIEKLPYTNIEIHPSLIFGVMGNLIAYPENSQLPRDLFSCGQSKQAVSLYHSNYLNRIDKSGIVLNNGQIPLIKSRYLKYINNEEHPYGINAVVAIGIYGSYNVEDSILFNKASLERGMFRTTYYNMYESREESSKVGNSTIDSKFTNIENENVIGLRPGYDYSYLDEYGLIKENTPVDEKTVVIGKVSTNLNDPNTFIDQSIVPKKGQLGFIDKSFITEGEEGFRIAKVRVREERIPNIGDKFCSRCGQKGTIGLVIPEDDMPFTSRGIRPDIIINPHALPSRMTISQLIECLAGKACAEYGAFGDATAFINKGPKNKVFGKLLTDIGYSSTGNEILYSGETGEPFEADIFIGPTYYMRLKHMVKDKINSRAKGPRTVLTRQTVQGRANDGGLRIGEMERDVVIAHGMASFLYDSLMKRGDNYYMAICNNTGTISIYNETKNLFLSPMADGPIKFEGLLDNNISIVDISRFGRNFSIINVPYSFKLLMQELQTMNICLRIITTDNIDQIDSMAFSKTLNMVIKKEDTSISKEKQSSLTTQIPSELSIQKELPNSSDVENSPPLSSAKEEDTNKNISLPNVNLELPIQKNEPILEPIEVPEESTIPSSTQNESLIKPITDAIKTLDETIGKGIDAVGNLTQKKDDELDELKVTPEEQELISKTISRITKNKQSKQEIPSSLQAIDLDELKPEEEEPEEKQGSHSKKTISIN